jgi:hypothetical protein
MPDDREVDVAKIAAEIRGSIDNLARELKLTQVVFAAVQTTIEQMIDADYCEFSAGYTREKREMN